MAADAAMVPLRGTHIIKVREPLRSSYTASLTTTGNDAVVVILANTDLRSQTMTPSIRHANTRGGFMVVTLMYCHGPQRTDTVIGEITTTRTRFGLATTSDATSVGFLLIV